MVQPIGERFAHAVAGQDADALKALLRSDVAFHAVTPGRCWEANDADAVVDDTMLGIWFRPERRIIDILGIETDQLGPIERVGYRFRVNRPDGEFVVEQQAYLETDGDRIAQLRIMCSGFVPIASVSATPPGSTPIR